MLKDADKSFAALPTYPVVLMLKGDSQELNNFASQLGKPIPGLPPLDLNKMVHGSQAIQILKELPLVSGPGWTLTSKSTGVIENSASAFMVECC